MTYCCEHCGFLFHRYGAIRSCPVCEHPDIRPATPEESERLLEQLEGAALPKGERV